MISTPLLLRLSSGIDKFAAAGPEELALFIVTQVILVSAIYFGVKRARDFNNKKYPEQ